MQSLADIFAEEEARRVAEANSPEAIARENAAYEARMAAPCPGGCGMTRAACACPDEEPATEADEECEYCGAVIVPGCECDQCDEGEILE